jgi:chromosome segregation ATPase
MAPIVSVSGLSLPDLGVGIERISIAMAEPHSYLEDPTALEPAAALRAELAQVRAEAEAERQRLEHELKLARSALPSPRDPIKVTQDVAGRQEIQALRNTLREKDRVIEQLTTQCRDLEDQLEDNFQQIDALRLRIQKRELDQARAQEGRRSVQQPHPRDPARAAPKTTASVVANSP